MFCKCGCGREIIKQRHHKFYTPSYIIGHNNKGKKFGKRTEEQCKRISEGTRTAMFSPEVREKIRGFRSSRIKFNCKECGKEIIRTKVRSFCNEECFKVWRASGKYKHSKETITKISKARFNQRFLTGDTLPERILRSILSRNLIEFIPQYNVDYKILADFYLPEFNTMLFADGDFWHCHDRFGFKDDEIVHHGKQVRWIKNKDAGQNEYLESKGFNVLRFWEKDLMKNENEVEQQLMKEICNER
jgi:G:T-mismatch repair DNA endonuclease (very short patch repair protein)